MEKPDDAELLAWLDGELTPERRAEIQQQLEADWELRTRLAQLERRIGKYIEATAHQTPAEIEPFDDFWQRLAPQLEELTATQTPSRGQVTIKTLFTRLSKVIAPQSYGWRLTSVVGIALFITAGLILYLSLSTRMRPVSAEELLQRSISGEDLRVKQLAEPVVYRKLQVKRVGAGEPVMWESWNDAQRNQYRQRVADKQGLRFLRANEKETPAVIAELEQILRANRFDPQRPLSAAAFAEWRKSIRTKAESVAETAAGLKLSTIALEPYAINTITEASLIVRQSDWHAVALQLKVQGEKEIREYELSETAYEVLPLQALTVFADLVPTPAPMTSPTISLTPGAASPSLVPSIALPTVAALQEAEVAALFALHQLQADLGEQIEVVREANQRVVVRGLVETGERKQQIVQALSGISLVSAQIQTVEEAVRQAQQNSAPKTSAPPTATISANEINATSGQVAPNVNPFQQKLAEHFGGRAGLSEAERQEVNRKVTQFYNAVEADASAAMAEAWALRRLQERFVTGIELDATSRQRLEEMLGNHTSRLRQRSRNLQSRLRPLLVSLVGETPAVSHTAEPTRQAQILAVFRAVEQVRRLTDQLIAGNAAATMQQTARALLTELTRLDIALTSI